MNSNNLAALFPSIKFSTTLPGNLADDEYIFENPYEHNWFTIKKDEVSDRDYSLLSSLYVQLQPHPQHNHLTVQWLNFLNSKGDSPLHTTDKIRVIQLYFEANNGVRVDLLEAFNAFFDSGLHFIFVSAQKSFIIEPFTIHSYTEEDYLSFITLLEHDFFIRPKLYIGKYESIDQNFSQHFSVEQDWFLKGVRISGEKRVFSMESIFPELAAAQLTDDIRKLIEQHVLHKVSYDEEMLLTVKTFVENGFNASITSDKLFIHRNTLHYRLAKFQDATGLSVRNFDGAFLAYFASLHHFSKSDKLHKSSI